MKNRLFIHTLALLAITSIGFSIPAIAEDIRVPVGQQAQDSGVDVPKTGMTKANVRAKFGDPLQESAPVGEPPISRWTYSEYVVYFEHDHVIRSVRTFHRKESTETVISE
jgi:hypothetical protein